MKMVKSLLLTSILATSIALPTNVFADEAIIVYVDGAQVPFQVAPINDSGTTLVQFRPIFEKLGFGVKWDENSREVEGSKGSVRIRLGIDSTQATINEKQSVLEKTARIEQGSTFIPLRFVAEASGAEVKWDGENNRIDIVTDISYYLTQAVMKKDLAKMKEYLSKGANPNYVDKIMGNTPLEWAIHNQNKEQVQLLLQNGANPRQIRRISGTILHDAVYYNNLDVVKLLVEAGADRGYTDSSGENPLAYARRINHPEIVTYLETLENKPVKGELNANGIKYVGDLVNGVPNGKGTYTMADGSKYDGEVKDNKPNGLGRFTMADGTYFEGQIVNGVFEGLGTFVLADKSKYVGEFKNGKPNGIGAIYAPSGVIVQQGEFKDGNLIRSTNTSTTTPTGTTGNSTSSSPNGTITTKSDLQSYLEKNFGELNTSLGATKFTFDIYENTSITSAYDYWIKVKYDSTFFYDVKYSNKISSDVRAKVKQELKDHQERIGRAVVQAMPSKKFDGGYYDSWYRYPNLRVDLITRHYFSWNNYDGTLISGYENTKPSTFRWQSLLDNDF